MSTPTKEQTLAAIDGSIAHWKRHATGTAAPAEGVAAPDCSLCELFLTLGETKTPCAGCPLAGFTGRHVCRHKTWLDAADDHESLTDPLPPGATMANRVDSFQTSARGMVALLEDTRVWFLANPKTRTAYFNRFEITMPVEAAEDCSHSGDCYADVRAWQDKIARPPQCTPEKLAAELSEYGAWEEDELKDDAANWHRIIWIAAGNIQEEPLYDPERYKNLPVIQPEPVKS